MRIREDRLGRDGKRTAADALHRADFFYDTSKHDFSSLPQSVPRVGGQQDVARHLLDLDA